MFLLFPFKNSFIWTLINVIQNVKNCLVIIYFDSCTVSIFAKIDLNFIDLSASSFLSVFNKMLNYLI